MPKFFIAALAVLGALLLPAAAASAKDRNHDKLPDRWEKTHHLSLHVKQTRRDQDHDGLRNLGEFKAGMNPRDKDSDDDGIKDDDENAGTITAFADGKLTIQTFGGDEVTGAVTDATEVECEGDDDQGEDEQGDDHGDDDATATLADHGDDDNSGPGSDDEGDDDHSGPGGGDDDEGDDDHGDDEDDDACAADALAVGAKVHEAELKITDAGAVWTEIELR